MSVSKRQTRDADMWKLLLCFLLGSVILHVRCTDGSFSVIWNVPTFMCRRHRTPFPELAAKWGIQQNKGDEFRGEKITILYDPGDFPALHKSRGVITVRNGGVPQAGNLSKHLQAFSDELDRLVPDVNFSGIGVIDMESWRPIWQQLFGSYAHYQEYSRKIERSLHPLWSKASIDKEAGKSFEEGAREFMETTLELARQKRPHGKWGYYAFPYCFNYENMNCSKTVEHQNDKIQWLFDESTAVFPSLYLGKKMPPIGRQLNFMTGRLIEAKRVAKNVPSISRPPIYPYIRYKYHDSPEFLSHDDLYNSLVVAKDMQLNGAIIWGSSKDLNSKEKCDALADYVDNELGPLVKNLTEISNFP